MWGPMRLRPPFAILSFSKLVVEGLKQTTKDEKRLRPERRKAMWTTPGVAPLAQPPVLHWEDFLRRRIPSDVRYLALFPDDPEKRSRIKDLKGERSAMAEYITGTEEMQEETARDSVRREFYRGLEEDVYGDWQDVHLEEEKLFATATRLG